MVSYVRGIWKCRYFWLSLVQLDLRTRYRRSVLGVGWSLLHPIAMTAVLCAVFHKVFGLDPREYAPSLMVGLCFWNFITSCTHYGCECLIVGEKYIRQFPAPMAIYPLRATLGASFHFAAALVVVLLLRVYLRGFSGVDALFGLVPALMMQFAFGWSVAVIAAFATAYFPDVKHISEVALQIMFYATPIIYTPDTLRKRGLALLVDLNPLTPFIEMLREPLLHGQLASAGVYGTAMGVTLVAVGIAVWTLVRLERRVIFQL